MFLSYSFDLHLVMTSLGDKISETVAIPILAGAIGWAGSKFALSRNGTYPIAGTEVDIHLLNGAIVAAGTFAGEMTKDFVLDYIPIPENIKEFGQMAVPPAMAGAGAIAADYLISNQLDYRMFLLGAGSQIGGAYAWDTVKALAM